MKRMFNFICVGLLILVPTTSWTEEPVIQTLTTECTTKGTSVTGRRRSCESDPGTIRAPENYVFLKDELKVRESSKSGGGPDCREEMSWGEYVEVLPGTGIKLPTSFTVIVHARSPGGMGNIGSRGWIKCSYKVPMTNFKI